MTTKEIINEIKGLRGAEVNYWGSIHKMPSEVDKYTIDIIDILEALEEYELPEELTKVDPSELNWDTSEFDVVLNRLVEQGYIEDADDYKGDNSYNWMSPISNHFDEKIWRTDNGTIVAIMVHRYGDVRANYTGHGWYRFADDYEFLELLQENGQRFNSVNLQGKDYWCDTDVFSDGIRVTTEDGNEFYVYELIEDDREMLQAVKEEVGFKTWLEICHELINAKKGV